jgi:hypothetical protein
VIQRPGPTRAHLSGLVLSDGHYARALAPVDAASRVNVGRGSDRGFGGLARCGYGGWRFGAGNDADPVLGVADRRGFVSIGYDLNFASGRNRFDTQYGKVLTRIVPQDGLEGLTASGRSVVWVLSHLLDDTGPGAYKDQVVLVTLSGKPHGHVLTS